MRNESDWDVFIENVIADRVSSLHSLAQDIPELVAFQNQENSWEASVLRSSALRKAFEGCEVVEDSAVIALLTCLGHIKQVTKYRENPRELLDPIELLRKERRRATDHIRVAAAMLSPLSDSTGDRWAQYRQELLSLAARVDAEPHPQSVAQALGGAFDPENLSTKGKASEDPEGAFNGWMTREMIARVPKGRGRPAAIVELLSMVDVHVSKETVTKLINRSEQKKT